jgi:hypothetical protein
MKEEDQAVQREPAFREMTGCVKEYKPSRMECLREYQINIRFLSVGCLIEVGCKSIPFSTIAEGMAALNNYIQDPYTVRQLWEKKFQEEL